MGSCYNLQNRTAPGASRPVASPGLGLFAKVCIGMSESSQNNNRRRYFRVQDRIGLEVRRIADEEDIQDLFEDQATLSLHQELRRIDLELRQQLASLADRDRNLAYLLKTFNHKLDTLARIMAFEQKPLQPEQWHKVTLSEGGVAFSGAGFVGTPGESLAVRLTLLPELQRVLVRAEVIEDSNGADGDTQVHLAFSGLSNSDRQTIARHVLRVQARERQGNDAVPR